MADDRSERRGVDILAMIAGLAFLFLSLVSLTVGILDLPQIGAAPVWVLLIVAGAALLFSELRARKRAPIEPVGGSEPSESSELSEWENDPYR